MMAGSEGFWGGRGCVVKVGVGRGKRRDARTTPEVRALAGLAPRDGGVSRGVE